MTRISLQSQNVRLEDKKGINRTQDHRILWVNYLLKFKYQVW